jgi:hypothetical protein
MNKIVQTSVAKATEAEQMQQTTKPELPEAVAQVSRVGTPSISWRQSSLAGLPDKTLLYTAAQIHDHYLHHRQ